MSTPALSLALDRIDEVVLEQPVLRAKLRGLLRAYVERWDNDDLEVLEVESLATAGLYNPETGASSKSFTLAGKKDVLVRRDGRLWLMDHKTASDDIEDPNANYWRQLIVEAQHHHYALIEHLNGGRVDGAIWDVTRKPDIAPRQLTKQEKADLAATGLWFGDAISAGDIGVATADKSLHDAAGRETPAMYEARVYWDASQIRPERYFQRRPIASLPDGLIEYARELWQHSQDLLWSRRQGAYPRNSGACIQYGGACKYLGICSGYDSPDSQNWKRVEWVHPELPVLNGGGQDVLTNSRVRCFQTCRKQHYFKYELGIDRVDAEEREALFFGHCWHEALAVIFESYIRKESDNGNTDDEPANAVGCTDASAES